MAALLTGAVVWGLIWYPYRAAGGGGHLRHRVAAPLTYGIALACAALICLAPQSASACGRPGCCSAIGLAAGRLQPRLRARHAARRGDAGAAAVLPGAAVDRAARRGCCWMSG
ncbi:MAG: hypothetical protein MZW92_78335 [Comamonadaceae bacterium]|nr:hypothetical protein [Comamonadaceae bacterium]